MQGVATPTERFAALARQHVQGIATPAEPFASLYIAKRRGYTFASFAALAASPWNRLHMSLANLLRVAVPILLLAVGTARAQTTPASPAPNATSATTVEAVTTTATPVPPAATVPVLIGRADEGRLRVYTCTGCHGIAGYRNVYPSYHVPKIHGQNAQYLVAALTSYREGQRRHPTMQAQGESLSDQDIADIAAYLSSAAKH